METWVQKTHGRFIKLIRTAFLKISDVQLQKKKKISNIHKSKKMLLW